MNEKIQQTARALIQAASQGNQEAAQQLEQIMAMAQAISQEMQAMQSTQGATQQPKAAKLGAKLDYINKLKGNCPEGEEVYYYRDGGIAKKGCKPCMAAAGMKAPEKEEKKKNNAVADFKKKQANKKLDPKTTKNLPNGKYPSNWDGNDRMVWEREHGSHDEGAHVVKNKGIKKNLCGGKTKKK